MAVHTTLARCEVLAGTTIEIGHLKSTLYVQFNVNFNKSEREQACGPHRF